MRTYNNNNTTKNSWSPRPEDKTKYNNAPKSAYKNFELKEKGKTRLVTPSNQPKSFIDAMEKTINSLYTFKLTENGAIAHASTGSKLLDMNFAVSSCRNKSEEEIAKMFRDAFNENPINAMRWLFFARDAREGLGERRLFRICIRDMVRQNQIELVNSLIPLFAVYGRYDDMLELLTINPKCARVVMKVIKDTWNKDIDNMNAGKPITLMAKWLDSEQASSAQARNNARIIMKGLGLSPRNYRKTLSSLRSYIDVVERKMSSDNWQAIDYETVPSKANLLYSKAFLRHDTERRQNYLNALEKGEAKINSSVAYPHEIVHQYCDSGWYGLNVKEDYDSALEGMWWNLPDMVQDNSDTLVVVDGSGSMTSRINGTKVSALEVSNGLGLYFAHRMQGGFKNSFITFSAKPQLVRVAGRSLHEDLKICAEHDDCSNTNIQATFELILKTAVSQHMTQEQLPGTILVLSDMEFDGYRYHCSGTLFDNIKKDWAKYGYKLPKLVYWNIMGRSGAIPMVENDMGVILVSGFSVNLCKMIMSSQTDPYEALLETINSERYDAVERAVYKAAHKMKPDGRANKSTTKSDSYTPHKAKSTNTNSTQHNTQKRTRKSNLRF